MHEVGFHIKIYYFNFYYLPSGFTFILSKSKNNKNAIKIYTFKFKKFFKKN